MRQCVTSGVLFTILMGVSGCQSSGYHTANGSAIGGLTGAAMGALAGSNRGKALEGAAIGAATGGALGGLLGNQVDQAEVRDASNRQAAYQEATSCAVSLQNVVDMVNGGLGESVIIEQVRTNGVLQPLGVNDLVYLKQRGVSDAIINAMQAATVVTPNTVVPPSHISPTVVQDHWVEVPPPVYYAPPPYYRWHHRPPPGMHWQIEF